MDQHIKKVYVPMTETAFFILLCLKKPNHGYGIVQSVEKMTDGAIKLTPGTMYGSLSKMEKDKVIRFVREEDKRKIYQITDLGLEVLQLELKRIERLYKIAQEEIFNSLKHLSLRKSEKKRIYSTECRWIRRRWIL